MTETLSKLYEQGLTKLRSEVESYPSEAELWKTSGNIPNSAGNLALHLVGNLNHFFGATLGGTGYVRDRDAEFSSGKVSKEELIREIDKAKIVVKEVLAKLEAGDLVKIYP